MTDEPTAADLAASLALPPRQNAPYDEPTAADLIEAVRSYLADDLLPRSTGADRWTLRVAANALAIAGREVTRAPEHQAAHQNRMEALGVADETELSQKIRSGDLDTRWSEVHASVLATVADKLDVANPGYADRP